MRAVHFAKTALDTFLTSEGEPIFDSNTSLAAPNIGPGQSPAIAIFTDADAANDFIECTNQNEKLDLVELTNDTKLKHFLVLAYSLGYQYLTVDLNAKNQSSRILPIAIVLAYFDDLD